MFQAEFVGSSPDPWTQPLHPHHPHAVESTIRTARSHKTHSLPLHNGPGKVSGFWSRLFSDHFLQVADVYIFTIRKRWSLLMILERSTKLPSLSDSNTYYTIIYIYIYTWNPNDPRFDWKKPCFGRAKAKNRGQTGSRYIHKYTHYIIIYRDTMYTPHSGSVFHMCYWQDSVGWPFLWAWRGETEDLFPALRWY